MRSKRSIVRSDVDDSTVINNQTMDCCFHPGNSDFPALGPTSVSTLANHLQTTKQFADQLPARLWEFNLFYKLVL